MTFNAKDLRQKLTNRAIAAAVSKVACRYNRQKSSTTKFITNTRKTLHQTLSAGFVPASAIPVKVTDTPTCPVRQRLQQRRRLPASVCLLVATALSTASCQTTPISTSVAPPSPVAQHAQRVVAPYNLETFKQELDQQTIIAAAPLQPKFTVWDIIATRPGELTADICEGKRSIKPYSVKTSWASYDGQRVYGQHVNQIVEPASTTKLLTAVLVSELVREQYINLDYPMPLALADHELLTSTRLSRYHPLSADQPLTWRDATIAALNLSDNTITHLLTKAVVAERTNTLIDFVAEQQVADAVNLTALKLLPKELRQAPSFCFLNSTGYPNKADERTNDATFPRMGLPKERLLQIRVGEAAVLFHEAFRAMHPEIHYIAKTKQSLLSKQGVVRANRNLRHYRKAGIASKSGTSNNNRAMAAYDGRITVVGFGKKGTNQVWAKLQEQAQLTQLAKIPMPPAMSPYRVVAPTVQTVQLSTNR